MAHRNNAVEVAISRFLVQQHLFSEILNLFSVQASLCRPLVQKPRRADGPPQQARGSGHQIYLFTFSAFDCVSSKAARGSAYLSKPLQEVVRGEEARRLCRILKASQIKFAFAAAVPAANSSVVLYGFGDELPSLESIHEDRASKKGPL